MARYYASTNNANWGIFYDVTEGNYSIENNTSPVGVNVYLYRTSSSSYYGGTANISFTLNGETKSTSVYPTYPTNIGVGESNAHYMASFSYTVGHDSDGSKSVSFSLSWSANFTPSSASGSGSMVLTTIPRASEISSVSTANIGSSATITVNRKSNSFTHTITYSFGSLSGTVATKSSNTSISWTIPTSFYGQIPNSKTGNGTLTITTYNGNTQIGSSSTKSFSVTTSESACKPTVTGNVIDSNSTTITITGNNKILIAGYSTASVSCSSSPKNSSSIKTISVNSKYAYTGTSYTEVSRTKELENFNSNTIVIKAKDSRGYENTKTLNSGSDYTLINYIPLTFSGSVSRQTPTGSVLLLSFSGNYFGSNLGNTSNSLNISWKYREKGEENWVNGRALIEGTDYTINSSNNTYSSGNSSFQSTISLGDNFNYQKAYEIAVFYNDVLVNASTVIQGLKGKPIINWGEDFFNVNGEIRQNNIPISAGGGSSITTTVDVGTTTTGASGTQAKVTNSGNSVNAVFDFVIPRGEKGDKGDPGSGIISGGTTGQVLAKKSNTNYDTEWITPVTTETDPIFVASPAYNITSNDITNWNNKSTFSGNYNDLANKPTIPSKTSDLTNDSNFVADASYVHTDNNFTSSLKNKLDGISVGAEVNVQANWNETNTTSDSYIQNKPTIPTVPTNLSSFTDDLGNTPVHTHSQYVDKVTGKGLSTNDFTDAYKGNVDSNTSARHTHSNKSVLDGISSTDITNWNNKSDFSGSYNDLTDKPLPFEIIQYHVNDEEIITKLNSCINYKSAKLLKMPVLCIPGTSEFGVYGDLSNRSTVYANLVYVTYGTPHKWVFRYLISNDSDFFLGREISYIIENNTITSSEETIKVLKRQELQKRLYSGTDIREDLLEIIMSIATSGEPNFEKLIDATFFESNIVNNIINANQYNFYNLTNEINNTIITFVFKFMCGNVIKEIGMTYDTSDSAHITNYEYWTLTIDGVTQNF